MASGSSADGGGAPPGPPRRRSVPWIPRASPTISMYTGSSPSPCSARGGGGAPADSRVWGLREGFRGGVCRTQPPRGVPGEGRGVMGVIRPPCPLKALVSRPCHPSRPEPPHSLPPPPSPLSPTEHSPSTPSSTHHLSWRAVPRGPGPRGARCGAQGGAGVPPSQGAPQHGRTGSGEPCQGHRAGDRVPVALAGSGTPRAAGAAGTPRPAPWGP